MKSKIHNHLVIRDLPEYRELDCETLQLIQGGRMRIVPWDGTEEGKGEGEGYREVGGILHAEFG